MENHEAIDLLYEIRECARIAIQALADVEQLRQDRDYWKGQYDALMQEHIRHSEIVTAGILGLALSGALPVRQRVETTPMKEPTECL